MACGLILIPAKITSPVGNFMGSLISQGIFAF